MASGFLVQTRASTIPFARAERSAGPPPVAPTAPALRQRLRPLEGKPPGTLVIHEIYRSLQGESTFAGLPCVFIRLTACHLRCVYCDTPHAFSQGEVLDLDEVVARAIELGDDLVELTGGEPLLQPEVYPLMTRLADAGKTVLLETSGAVDIAAVDPRVRIILDIKTPGSGEAAANVWSNLDRLKPTDELKVVVCDRDDFDWAAGDRPRIRACRALPRPLQRRLRLGQSDRARRLDPRIPPAGAAPAPAAQDPLGPRGPRGLRGCARRPADRDRRMPAGHRGLAALPDRCPEGTLRTASESSSDTSLRGRHGRRPVGARPSASARPRRQCPHSS